MTRALLVGELNPYGELGAYALYPRPRGSAGHRLASKIMQLPPLDYLEHFERVNLCTKTWRMKDARAAAAAIINEGQHRRIVLLGSKVCAAFGVKFLPFQIVTDNSERKFAILPHPSGRNRLWNNPIAYERARRVLVDAGVLKRG